MYNIGLSQVFVSRIFTETGKKYKAPTALTCKAPGIHILLVITGEKCLQITFSA